VAGLFKWGVRKEKDAPALPSAPATASDPPTPSKVLPKFLSALAPVVSPVLLNLGPVIGQNISFFGDKLSCKIFVEDFFPDIESHVKRNALNALPAVFESRLRHEPGSVDGILCWDLFDFLDKASSKALAARLVTLLKPGGVLYGFFGQTNAEIDQYTRFTVETPTSFRLKTSPGPRVRRNVLVTRDINKMFDGLVVAESVLLKSSARETLFRKP
jgi:hypothetical protein